MIYSGYEILQDSTSNDLYDASGELLLVISDGYMVKEVFEVEALTLTPNPATINAKVKAIAKVFEGVIEIRLPVWYSGDIYAGEV